MEPQRRPDYLRDDRFARMTTSFGRGTIITEGHSLSKPFTLALCPLCKKSLFPGVLPFKVPPLVSSQIVPRPSAAVLPRPSILPTPPPLARITVQSPLPKNRISSVPPLYVALFCSMHPQPRLVFWKASEPALVVEIHPHCS